MAGYGRRSEGQAWWYCKETFLVVTVVFFLAFLFFIYTLNYSMCAPEPTNTQVTPKSE